MPTDLRSAAPGLLLAAALAVPGVTMGKRAETPPPPPEPTADERADALIAEHVQADRPLYRAAGEAFWSAMTTGDPEAFARKAALDEQRKALRGDPDRFARIRTLLADPTLGDPALRRQLEMLERDYVPHQIPAELRARINALENEAEQRFNNYRMTVDDRTLSMADVERIMRTGSDSAELEAAWKASKRVGAEMLPLHQELVALRNEAAQGIGYADHVELALRASEFDPAWLETFFAEVERATDEPFRRLKEEVIDPQLATRFGVAVEQLRPWHYGNPYFQDVPPGLFDVDLDGLYARRDHEQVVDDARDFFAGVGMPADTILGRSDLYPREGKNPHAMAHKMDLEQRDTAILLMNLPRTPDPQNRMGTATLLHELGHCVHYEAVDHALPYLFLEIDSQPTEALAMLLERQVVTADWMTHYLGVDADEATRLASAAWRAFTAQELIFARWCLVIYHWERDIHADPDQDWGDAWWRYKERFQGLTRPAGWSNPDPLAKYHLATGMTAYYNNYAVGGFIAAQLAGALAAHTGQDVHTASYRGRAEVGAWLTERYAGPGSSVPWLQLVERATGEPLSTAAWRAQFVTESAPDSP